jgi:hypothetical protein
VRLYPSLISGLPYSTDGWSCIRNSELLIKYSPVSLVNSTLFDGYNNYWPGLSLFGAVFSEVTGAPVINVFALAIPLAGALTVPLFFVFVRKLSGNLPVALIATLLLATSYPFVMSTAGATKEAFAAPIYLSLLLIFLMAPSWKQTLLFSAASAALILSHHMTMLLTIGVLAFLTFALFISKDSRFSGSLKQNLWLLVIICGFTGVYYGFFALQGLPLAVSEGDLLALAAYQVLAFSVVMFFVGKVKLSSSKGLIVRYLAVLAVSFGFVLFLTKKALFSSGPVLPFTSFLFFVPYIIVIPMVFFSFKGLHEHRSCLLVPVFWLTTLVAFEGFAVFGGSPMSLLLAYRALNFLVLPLFILAGLAFYRLYVHSKALRLGKVVVVGLAVAVFVVASVGSYSLYASVSLQQPYLGYFWFYRSSEVSGAQWVAVNAPDLSVAGDMKVSYLLKGYFNVPTDVAGGLQFLGGSGSKPQILWVYPEMFTNGYVVYSGNVASLPQNWTAKLGDLNQVYANNMVSVYAK